MFFRFGHPFVVAKIALIVTGLLFAVTGGVAAAPNHPEDIPFGNDVVQIWISPDSVSLINTPSPGYVFDVTKTDSYLVVNGAKPFTNFSLFTTSSSQSPLQAAFAFHDQHLRSASRSYVDDDPTPYFDTIGGETAYDMRYTSTARANRGDMHYGDAIFVNHCGRLFVFEAFSNAFGPSSFDPIAYALSSVEFVGCG